MSISLDERPLERPGWRKLPTWIKVTTVVVAVLLVNLVYSLIYGGPKLSLDDVCVQYPEIVPSTKYFNSSLFLTDKYVKHSAELLGGAVKIPTVSYDDMAIDPLKDDRFLIFKKLHHYLDESFPLSSKHRETVNEYGLLYTFPGSDKSLKPIVIMAHQDVVPVNPDTVNQWTYPPFSGHYDGKFLYGRGASDTKNTLIASLESTEALLEQEWHPKRTVILSFGFDEEVEGVRGAQHLADTLFERYGRNGVEVIIDEGVGIMNVSGGLFALPSVSEKGRSDFYVELLTPGGHSSMPPKNSGIGIMARLATALEDHPISPKIEPDGVIAQLYSCVGRWAPDLTVAERSSLTRLDKAGNQKKLIKQLEGNKMSTAMIETTQAIDIINGGVKINALPEKVVMGVDYRIAVHQTLGDIKEHLTGYILEVAEAFDIPVEFDGERLRDGNFGAFNITTHDPIAPAPISATHGHVWEKLVGVTKHALQSVAPFWDHKEINVGPSVLFANSDTAWYWGVSDHIYRYTPGDAQDGIDFHTVNERLRFRSHISAVIFFYEWIINWTE